MDKLQRIFYLNFIISFLPTLMMFPLFIAEGLKPESKVDSSNLTAFCEISRFASLELLDILISTKNFCKDIDEIFFTLDKSYT